MSTPPGWFQDPHRPPGHLRWWDGRQWAEHRTAPPATPRTAAPGWAVRHRWLVVTATLLALVTVLVAVGAATDETTGDGNGSLADPGSAAGGEPEVRPTRDTEAERPPSADPTPEPAKRTRRARPAERTHVVTRVVDGDTIELGNGETVRLVGIDTPEVGECGYERAADKLAALVLGRAVRLGASDEHRDGYGRLLRYVDVGDQDAGLRLIKNGLAIARYDSRDGYGFHPREQRYIAADKGARQLVCAPPPRPQPLMPQEPPGGSCAPGYDPCVPPYPPDVDCADVNGPIYVSGSDPHGLDADGDGVACE